MVKSELEKLSLIELKNLCKKEGLNFDKSKDELIFALDEYFKPMRIKPTTTTTKSVKYKTKAIKLEDSQALTEMGKLVEKKLARRTYYANGNIYFELLD
jgi:hypothetical protein